MSKPVPALTKAYDVANLVERLKNSGLDVTEDAAKKVLHDVFAWVGESATMSENKVDDLVALGIPQLEKVVMPLIDKIDGEADLPTN